MKFTMGGGDALEGASPRLLVEAMRADAMAWAPSVSIEDYMEAAAERAAKFNGSQVDAGAPWPFVRDLLRGGILIPVYQMRAGDKLDVGDHAAFFLEVLRELLPGAAHRLERTEYGWEYWSTPAGWAAWAAHGGNHPHEFLQTETMLAWVEKYLDAYRRGFQTVPKTGP